MEKGKNVSYIIIGILLAAVVGLSIAYAALSTSLNINFGTVTQSQQSWNVAFETNSSLAATVSGTSDTGRLCGTANVTADTAEISATQLSKPDDKCVWALNILNTGSIDANLQTITPTNPTGTGVSCTNNGASMTCGNITYKLTTDAAGTTLLTTNTTLASTDNLPVYLVATYSGTELNNSNVVQTGAAFTLNFNQK